MTSLDRLAAELPSADVQTLTRALAAPFELNEVRWKPQAVKGNRALAVAYVDARAIMDRLDDVVGVEGWQDEYHLLPDNSVVCRLRLRLGRRWITKMDVGSPSEQPDGGDRLKAAFSDALKRAAVKFGIGRYLHRLPPQWCDYDPAKKQFTSTPRLPAIAAAKPAKAPAPSPAAAPSANGNGMPTNGEDLHRRLRQKDTELAAQGRCHVGALLTHVSRVGVQAGYGADLDHWPPPAITLAVEESKRFMAKLPAARAEAVAASA